MKLDLRREALEEEKRRCLQSIENRRQRGAPLSEITVLTVELNDRVQDGMARIELDRSAIQLRHQKQLLEIKKSMKRPLLELTIGQVDVAEVSLLTDLKGGNAKRTTSLQGQSDRRRDGTSLQQAPVPQESESVVYSEFSQSSTPSIQVLSDYDLVLAKNCVSSFVRTVETYPFFFSFFLIHILRYRWLLSNQKKRSNPLTLVLEVTSILKLNRTLTLLPRTTSRMTSRMTHLVVTMTMVRFHLFFWYVFL